MKRILDVALLLLGGLLAGFLYDRFVVSRSMGPTTVLMLIGFAGLIGFVGLTRLTLGTKYAATMVNLWLAGTSAVVCYLTLDLGAGLFLIRPLSPPLVPDAVLHHRLVPNSSSRLQQPDFAYIQRVNNIGLRGRDVTVEKPPSTRRLVMLGDSFTMGKGVEDHETFSVLIEQALTSDLQACGGNPVEVVNAGVDSYAPVLSFLQLKRDLQPLSPDVVVLNLDVSDLAQERAYRSLAVRGPDGEIQAVPMTRRALRVSETVTTWVDGHLFLTRALFFYASRYFASGGRSDPSQRDVITHADYEAVGHTLAADTDPRDALWKDLFDSILGIKRFCEAHGTDFILSIYPWGHQVDATEWVPGRYVFMPADASPSDRSPDRVRAFAAANSIPIADAFAAFRSAAGGERLYFDHDMHWTPAGHRVMAKSLLNYLEARYAPAWCSR